MGVARAHTRGFVCECARFALCAYYGEYYGTAIYEHPLPDHTCRLPVRQRLTTRALISDFY